MESPNISLVFDLADAGRNLKTGAKAASLARLHAAGCAVPRAFVVSADAYRAHLWSSGARPVAAQAVAGENASTHREEVRSAILHATVPDDVRSAVAKAYERLSWQCGSDDPAVVVRSSALEGTQGETFLPGAYESFVNVRGLDAVLEAVKRVWASLWCIRAGVYRTNAGSSHEPAMAVIVQQALQPNQKGTVHTANPVTGDPRKALVSWSSADAGGFGDVDCKEIDLRESATSDDPVLGLVLERSVLIEEVFGGPVQVEWAFDRDGLWFLQAGAISGLPDFFPMPADEEPAGRWDRVTREPIRPFSRSLLSLADSSDLNTRTATFGTAETREINGYVYARREVATDQPDSRRPAHRAQTRIAAGNRLLGEWQKAGDELKAAAHRVTHRSICEKADWRLLRLLESAATSARTAQIWMEQSRLLAASAANDLRDMLGEDGWAAMGFSLLSGVSSDATRRDETMHRFGARFAEAEDSGRLGEENWWRGYRREVQLFASDYGYSFADQQEMYDLATWKSWIENLDIVFRMIAAMIHHSDERPPLATRRRAVTEAAEAASQTATGLFQGRQRARFVAALRLAKGWIAGQVEAEQVYALCCSAVRTVLMELAGRLVQRGVINEPDDIFFLTLDDVLSIPTKPGAGEQAATAALIAQSKHEMWLQSRLRAPERVEGACSAEPSGLVSAKPLGSDTSTGMVDGRALIGRTIEEAAAIEPGQILVVEEATLAWTPFLSVASGMVSEGIWSSGIAIAREYGVPVASGRAGATSALKNGQRLRINGEAGTVEINPTEQPAAASPHCSRGT